MESLKTRSSSKLTRTTLPSQRNEKGETKFTDEEKKIIVDLKKLYLETIKLDVNLQRDIYNMEKVYEVKHNEIFDKRKKVLEEFKKKNHGDANSTENVTNFWLKVLKASYTEFISKRDEKTLAHLTDIRSKLYNDPTVKFVIEFHFEPNEDFTNRVLTKSYFLNCLPDPNEPLSYDGAEIYKCEGCHIDWKQPKDRQKKCGDSTSFFDFFTPPKLPDSPEDPNYCDINAILQNDFELGFYLKERVIPKAVVFFTGEIADCQSLESSEIESEDSDEESDGDEEEESSANETEK